jgi:hypothetical protein
MKYEMQEVQLSILQCGGQTNATIIQAVWEKILNIEFEKIRETSKLTPLIEKLRSLGKKFIMTDYFAFSMFLCLYFFVVYVCFGFVVFDFSNYFVFFFHSLLSLSPDLFLFLLSFL